MRVLRELSPTTETEPSGRGFDAGVPLWPSLQRFLLRAAIIAGAVAGGGPALAAQCPVDPGVSVQVLGSGGPVADDARASSAYLVWVDGKARALVDVGGGAVLRFGEAGASFEDLDAILLTHLHADHSADLPALLKSGFFSGRERSLVLAGPSGGGNERVSFPSVEDFLAALLQPGAGAYPYLGGYLDGTEGMPYLRLAMIELDDVDDLEDDEDGGRPEGTDEDDEELEVDGIPLRDSPLTIEAMGGSHGPVPAVVYAVTARERRLVFAGDHNGRGDSLSAFAKDADLLVLHMPIPEGAGEAARVLHAVPSRLGAIARNGEVDALVLSHFMARSLADLEANVAEVRKVYPGPVTVAEDLACITID